MLKYNYNKKLNATKIEWQPNDMSVEAFDLLNNTSYDYYLKSNGEVVVTNRGSIEVYDVYEDIESFIESAEVEAEEVRGF